MVCTKVGARSNGRNAFAAVGPFSYKCLADYAYAITIRQLVTARYVVRSVLYSDRCGLRGR